MCGRPHHYMNSGITLSHFHTWVRTSLSSNLEELDLSICQDREPIPSNYSGQMFELPRSIFSCKKLVVLKLSGNIHLNLPSSFNLPSLKILHLYLAPYNDKSDWRLLSGCPGLEDLVVERVGDYYDEAFKLKICVPTLKRLKFAFRILEPEHSDYEPEINAPGLEYFDFKGDLRQVVFLEKLPNLVEADVDISAFEDYFERDDYGDTEYYAEKVFGLIRELFNVKFLSLSHGTTECLSFAYDYDLPIFHNLAQLDYNSSCCNWHVLPYLLQQAPNLKVLVVDKSYCTSDAHPPVCQKQPLYIPRNLSPPHLTTFYFRGFEGSKNELKFVRFILKKAGVLKKMTLRYDRSYQTLDENEIGIFKKVSNFPRCSMSCQIAFEYKNFSGHILEVKL